jgi:hypothetical protein
MMATPNIGIYCFSTKYTALRSKSKDWLTQNHHHVVEWTVVSVSQHMLVRVICEKYWFRGQSNVPRRCMCSIKNPANRVGVVQS